MAVEASVAPSVAVQPNRKQGLWLVLGAVLLWSTTGPFIETLGRDFQLKPIELSLWRTLLITLILAPIVWKREGWRGFTLTRYELGMYALNGFIGIAVFNVAWSGSVQTNGTAVASTLLYCAPVIVALGGWLLLGERVGLDRGIAIVINLLGCALVTGVYDPTTLFRGPEGVLLGIGAGFTFAIYTLLNKMVSRRHRRSASSSLFYLFLFGFLPLIPWGLLQEGSAVFSPSLNIWGWFLLATLSFGPTLLGYAFFNASLKYLPAAVASLFTTLELPFAALQAYLLFGRLMTLPQWFGAALILGGVVGLQFNDLRLSLKARRA